MVTKNYWTLAELAERFKLTLRGDSNCQIVGISTIQKAKQNQITFLTNPTYKKYLATTEAAAVILSASEAENFAGNSLISKNPHYAFAQIATLFAQKPVKISGIHATAIIGKNCQIDPTVSIGPYCVIEDNVTLSKGVVLGPHCFIGNDTKIAEDSCLDARVTVYHHCMIGKRVMLASGVVIGSDGFGFAQHQGRWHKVPQLGGVVLEDDVDIGANTTIDRGAIENTVIEQGAKLDNQIQVGHNVRIGAHTVIAGCVGIAGSTVIGKYCLIGGGTGITGHIDIADKVIITGQSSVTKSITEPGMYSGVGGLFLPNLEWRKQMAKLHRLEQVVTKIVKNLTDKFNSKE